jgi:hypothetical protein
MDGNLIVTLAVRAAPERVIYAATRPGGMTVPDRAGWHLPGPCAAPIAGARRWPSPDPACGDPVPADCR